MRKLGIIGLAVCIAAPVNAQQQDTTHLRDMHRHLQAMAQALHGHAERFNLQAQALERHRAHLEAAVQQMHDQARVFGARGATLHEHLDTQAMHLERMRAELEDIMAWQRQLDALAPDVVMLPQDPADSVWRVAHQRLENAEFAAAADGFRMIRTQPRYSSSGYRPQSFYWEAFSLARTATPSNLRTARDLLVRMREEYPTVESVRDAGPLLAAIDGRLAANGDAEAVRATENRATAAMGQCPPPEEQQVRLTALHALARTNPATAMTALREISGRRDGCSAQLRASALVALAQLQSAESSELLAEIAGSDPDPHVAMRATSLLASMSADAAIPMIEAILEQRSEPQVQHEAIMALSRHNSPRATELLRGFAADTAARLELRAHAIAGLGGRPGNAPFLQELFATTADARLKHELMKAIAHGEPGGGSSWLTEIAMDPLQPLELRRQALGRVGVRGTIPVARLSEFYDGTEDIQFRAVIISTLARSDTPETVDALMRIARVETNAGLRTESIRALAQSEDPRVPEFLLEIIRR